MKVGDLVKFSERYEEIMLRYPDWYGNKTSGVIVKVKLPEDRGGYNPGMIFFYTYYEVMWNDGEVTEHHLDELEILENGQDR